MIDIAIIGGGPAGLAAGLYAGRGGANTVLFEELFVGGQAAKTQSIENYPGFAEGIEGIELGVKMEQQASRFGMQTQYAPVERLELTADPKRIYAGGTVYEAKTVIIATGAAPRKLGLAREDELTGAGVSYCATCDGALFRGKNVAVVGGGDTALSDAIYLARFAKKVSLVHRRNAFRGSPTLQQTVLADERIEVVWDSVPDALLGEEQLSALRVKNVKTGELREIEADGLFVAIGIIPRTQLVADALAINDGGYIITDRSMQTSVPGVYAIGDVRDTPLRQVVTAVADGAVAATSALERLA